MEEIINYFKNASALELIIGIVVAVGILSAIIRFAYEEIAGK